MTEPATAAATAMPAAAWRASPRTPRRSPTRSVRALRDAWLLGRRPARLACAALLGDRVVAAATFAGAAPADAPDLDFMADDLAFVKPWGFDLNTITVPLQVWQGEQDLMVPVAHGRWLARNLPGADARISAQDGHLTLGEHRVGEVHAWLLDQF